MKTPLIMILCLVVPYSISLLIRQRLSAWKLRPQDVAVVSLAILFFVAGVGHFAMTQPMMEMLPPWIPWKRPVIYLTGIWELLLGVMVLIPARRTTAGWLLVLTLVAFLPANIYAAISGVGLGGHRMGPIYLWIRVPLQAFFIAWVYIFTIRSPQPTESSKPAS